MAKHTPGPWKFTEGDAETRAMSPIWAGPGSKMDWDNNRQTLIGWALCDSNVNQRPEDLANARLIAAAPELLAALKYMLPLFEDSVLHVGAAPGADRLMAKKTEAKAISLKAATEAIAKAEGA